MKEAHTELLPSAGRLMSSLRDIGYDAHSALADLVDNSIDANAHSISVDLVADGERSYVRVADDGIGMSERVVNEAMRFGSRRTYGANDLGAFGLGLKTASLSQARRITVATKTTATGRTQIRRWDLDDVIAQDRWRLERPGARHVRPELLAPLRGSRGTVVLWENLDRLVGRPVSPHAARTLEAVARHVSEHIGMVFHRYLSGEAGGRAIAVRVNGEPVEAWDPFARGEPATRTLPHQVLRFEHDSREHEISITPYVMPAQHQFRSVEAHSLAAGPHRWNRQQGLYIYRRERLIQPGGWNRLRTVDEHSKLARVAVDIPLGGDEAFRVNVSKMHVSIPDQLRPPLRAIVAGVVGIAQDVYRQHGVRESRPEPARPSVAGLNEAEWDLGGDWPVITRVLGRELKADAQRLDRILIGLVNARRDALSADRRPRDSDRFREVDA